MQRSHAVFVGSALLSALIGCGFSPVPPAQGSGTGGTMPTGATGGTRAAGGPGAGGSGLTGLGGSGLGGSGFGGSSSGGAAGNGGDVVSGNGRHAELRPDQRHRHARAARHPDRAGQVPIDDRASERLLLRHQRQHDVQHERNCTEQRPGAIEVGAGLGGDRHRGHDDADDRQLGAHLLRQRQHVRRQRDAERAHRRRTRATRRSRRPTPTTCRAATRRPGGGERRRHLHARAVDRHQSEVPAAGHRRPAQLHRRAIAT